MSNLISGLSIDITLNSLKLEKGLRSVRQHLRATQSEANASFQEWKHGEKSLNSYNRVVESSTKHIDAQKKTLEELKKRQTELTNARNDSLDADGNATKETKKLNDELIRNAREISEVENKLGFHERQLAKVKEEYKAFVKEQELANNKWNVFGKKIEESGKKLTNFGNKMQSLGGNLTDKITKPALGATTAIAGMFTGLGVKRLVAIDEANAKMRGLGHDAEKYAETVSNAVDGTLLTYAEGMDITAGALSAGVKEGKELEKYIRLVGNASAGSGRQASETAQIFNRVVGGGKLMTQELNMIEDGMPGFSKAMAKHLDVPQEKFREMVTKGEVSADDFLTVMDDFSGELSKEMATTFPGLVKNTFSRIGKLGEVFWSGTYDRLKDQLAKFAELLTSDELKKTFAEWGKKFANFVEKIINGIYKLIKWWTSLSDTTKKIIGILGLVTVAMGPVILMVGKFITTIGTIMTVVGPTMSGIAKLGGVIGILTNPITLAIAGITALVAGFVLAYNRSENFKNTIKRLIERLQDGIQFIKNFSIAIKELFINEDGNNGNKLLEKLGLTDNQIKFVNSAIDNIKSAFSSMKDLSIQAFSSIKEFFGDMVAKISSFWNENGEQVMNAIQNAIKIIGKVIEEVSPIVKIVFVGAFKVALFLIKGIWDSIKGVIEGALNIILGVVKLFSSIFTGDFRGMWEGVKQIFVGAIQFVWNLFNLLFYGRIIRGVGSLVKIFTGSIKGLWTRVVYYFKNLFTGSVQQVSNLYNRTVNIGNLIRNIFSNIISNLRTRVVSLFSKLYHGSINQLQKLLDIGRGIVNRIRSVFTGGIGGMKDKVVSLYVSMKNQAQKQLNKMLGGVKELPGKMKDALIRGKGKVIDGVKSLGNGMTSKLGNVVNGVIGGINTVMSKIGIDKKISEWTVPSFSTGTQQGSPSRKFVRNGRIAEDTMALVGDKGPGNGKGTREIVEFPNGKVGLFDNNQTIFAPKGTRIFNNRQTEDILANIPRFSIGTWVKDKYQKGKNKVKSGINWASNKVTDLLDAPRTVFNSIVSSFYDGFAGFKNFAKDFGKGMWNQAKSGLYSWLKGRFSEAGEGRKQNFMNFPMTTIYSPNRPIPGYPFNGGRHWGVDYGTPSNTNITAPSAGTVTRQSDYGGGIVARLKQANGFVQYFLHMNSVSTGRKKAGDSVGKSGNTGRYTTGPHLHWQVEKGTNFLQNRNTVNPLSIIKKHALGGIINREGLYLLGENDKEEVVIPMERQNEAMKLVTYVAEKLKSSNSTQTKHIPNISTSRNQNKDTSQDEQVELLKQQINELKKSNELLMGISEKTIEVSLSAKEVASKTYKEVNRLIESDKNRRARLV